MIHQRSQEEALGGVLPDPICVFLVEGLLPGRGSRDQECKYHEGQQGDISPGAAAAEGERADHPENSLESK